MEGTIYDSVDFVWEYDFATAMNPKNFQAVQGTNLVLANGSSVFTGTGITDMNVTLKYIPLIGNFTVGSFLVPFSFELATSDRWMDFIERSAAFDSFVPATNFANYTLGARINNWNESETLTYAASLSTNNMWDGASGFDFGNDYMVTSRVTRPAAVLRRRTLHGRSRLERLQRRMPARSARGWQPERHAIAFSVGHA